MRQQFVALLRGGIKADGIAHLVVLAERHLLVAAVYADARIHQVFHRIVAAGFQDVVEANDIAFDYTSG